VGTTAPAESDTEPAKSGCKSSLTVGTAAVLLAAAAAAVAMKKKED
jgi:hypothetical protein